MPKLGNAAKISISNLHFGVTDNDIQELFKTCGNMKSAAVHHDSNGQSLGTAHVLYAKPAAALQAMKQFNGVLLDGRPLKIAIEGAAVPFDFGKRLQTPAVRGIGRGRGRGGRGRGRGRGAKAPTPKLEDLDAEMDAYISSKDAAPSDAKEDAVEADKAEE